MFSLLGTHAQRARRRGRFAAGIKVRKAVLTDCSSGKYSATSGERRAGFVWGKYADREIGAPGDYANRRLAFPAGGAGF